MDYNFTGCGYTEEELFSRVDHNDLESEKITGILFFVYFSGKR